MEKKNGINYENGLPIPTNGGWGQTTAYLLDLIKNNQVLFNNNFLQYVTGDTSTLTIIKTTTLPQDTHIELYNPHPEIVPSPMIESKRVYVQPPTRVIRKPVMEVYKKCCGSDVLLSSKQQKKYQDCMNRVDYCYNKIKECKGMVTNNDMSMYKIKLSDCGCSYNPNINDPNKNNKCCK